MFIQHLVLVSLVSSSSAGSPMAQIMRCTRRYTPGFCRKDVRLRWTFVWNMQDCIPRLGCPPTLRENRFYSHEQCTRRCQTLLDVYTALLNNYTAQDVDTDDLRSGHRDYPRRYFDGSVRLFETDAEDSNDPKEYDGMAREEPYHVEVHEENLEELALTDIDKEAGKDYL